MGNGSSQFNPTVIKHGLLENPPFCSMIFASYKSQLITEIFQPCLITGGYRSWSPHHLPMLPSYGTNPICCEGGIWESRSRAAHWALLQISVATPVGEGKGIMGTSTDGTDRSIISFTKELLWISYGSTVGLARLLESMGKNMMTCKVSSRKLHLCMGVSMNGDTPAGWLYDGKSIYKWMTTRGTPMT